MVKKQLHKAVEVCLWVISVTGVFVMLGFAVSQHESIPCKGVNINIDYSTGNYFIMEDDITSTIKNMGYSLEGSPLSSIEINQIEKILNNDPVVLKADVYKTINGYLAVDVQQRKPILRVFNQVGESFYIDNQGKLMPLSKKFTARVPVATGRISETYSTWYAYDFSNAAHVADSLKSNLLVELYNIAAFIESDPFWKAQINQLHVNEKNEIEIIPRVGNHEIILGTSKNLEEKLDKLATFYHEGLSKTGWNEYKTINLKYNNQVICTKTNNYGLK